MTLFPCILRFLCILCGIIFVDSFNVFPSKSKLHIGTRIQSGKLPFVSPSTSSLFSSSSSSSSSQSQSQKPNIQETNTLIPEENPYFSNSTSDIKSNLYPYTSLRPVLEGLHTLYPPKDLEKRNAASRTDGYWKYINSGQKPPLQFTYGEFDFYFFADLLDKAYDYYSQYNPTDNNNRNVSDVDEDGSKSDQKSWEGRVFCDIGSGTGRLVLAAAALHPGWKLCKGIEILEGIHKVALENLEKCRTDIDPTAIHTNDEYARKFSSSTSTSPMISKDIDLSILPDDLFDDPTSTTTSNSSNSGNYVDQFIDDDFMADVMASLSAYQDQDGFSLEDYFDEEEVEESTSDDNVANETNYSLDNSTTIQYDEVQSNSMEITSDSDPSEQNPTYAFPVPYSMTNTPFTNNTSDIAETTDTSPSFPLAPIQFTQGSFTDPYLHLSDIDVAFVFSSCMSSSIISSLSQALGRQCRPGTILITTDYPLILEGTCEAQENDPSMPFGTYRFELLNQMDGYCWLVGGVTTAYIHVVKESLWESYGTDKRDPPELSLEEQAWKLVQAREDGSLTDTNKFLKEVYNKMMFYGYSEWSAGLKDELGDDV